ncbi:MAG: PadR family transcriptional regulator [Chloroflexota bacterium]
MDKPATRLTPLAVAVASLLDERPMHPYEMSQAMRVRHMEEAVKLNFGSLYHTVELMQRSGLIEATSTGRHGRRPERTIYRLTDRGRELFRERLRELLAEPAKEYSGFEAGLAFMHHLPADEACTLLRQRMGNQAAGIAETERVLGMLARGGLARLCIVEVEHAVAMRRAEIKWIEGLVEEIETSRLEWFAGIREPVEMEKAN